MTSDPTHPAPEDDDAAFARQIIDAGRYLVLATAGSDGRPWPTPVWFARDGREFLWLSRPQARHSGNVTARAEVGFVVFETPVPTDGRTRAVYAEAIATEVPDADRERCIAVVDRRARAQGLRGWTAADVVDPAGLRLYRAVVLRFFVLHPDRDIRREVALDV